MWINWFTCGVIRSESLQRSSVLDSFPGEEAEKLDGRFVDVFFIICYYLMGVYHIQSRAD